MMDGRTGSPYDNFDPSLWDGAGSDKSRSASPTATMKLIEAQPASTSNETDRPLGRLLKLTTIDTISDTIPDNCDNIWDVTPTSHLHPDSAPNNNTKDNGKRRGLFFRRKPKQPKVESPKKVKAKKDKEKKEKEKKEKKDKKEKEKSNKNKKEIEATTLQIPTSSFPSPNTADPSVDITMPPVEIVERTKAEKCVNCCKKFMAFLFSTIGLSGMMIAYTFFGGFIFMKLEGPNEELVKNNVLDTRQWHVERLWNLTVEMNVLHPENWSYVAEKVMESFQTDVFIAIKKNGWDGKDGQAEIQWTFAGAMLYSITVITTIGYGHITPKTDWGRLVTIAYALFGIPLTLLTVSNLGSIMATAFRFLYKNVCCGLCCLCCQKPKRQKVKSSVKYKDAENGDPGASRSLTSDSPDSSPKKVSITVTWRHGIRRLLETSDNKTVSVPIYISLLLIATYIFFGAVLFTLWEDDWDLLIGSYFCFITLTTIGFGDYVPGTAYDSWASQEKLILCSMYLIFGLALIAMCFDLMQEEVRNKCRSLGKKIGLVSKTSKGKDHSPTVKRSPSKKTPRK